MRSTLVGDYKDYMGYQNGRTALDDKKERKGGQRVVRTWRKMSLWNRAEDRWPVLGVVGGMNDAEDGDIGGSRRWPRGEKRRWKPGR